MTTTWKEKTEGNTKLLKQVRNTENQTEGWFSLFVTLRNRKPGPRLEKSQTGATPPSNFPLNVCSWDYTVAFLLFLTDSHSKETQMLRRVIFQRASDRKVRITFYFTLIETVKKIYIFPRYSTFQWNISCHKLDLADLCK